MKYATKEKLFPKYFNVQKYKYIAVFFQRTVWLVSNMGIFNYLEIIKFQSSNKKKDQKVTMKYLFNTNITVTICNTWKVIR